MITNQLRYKSTLYLSIVSPDILEKDLQIVQIEIKRLVVNFSLSY